MGDILLPVEDIPSQLWDNNVICMPSCLVRSYEELLNENGVKNMALDETRQSHTVVGGQTLQDTLEHFARRYGVSSCRIESLVIDPSHAFQSISQDMLNIFSEGRIALLDIACGCGSVGASLLSTLYVLRQEMRLPKTPMTVQIVGGDCSPTALDIYGKMMNRLTPNLETVGISLQLQTVRWNAEASYETSELFDQLFDPRLGADEYIVIIANFSGTLNAHFSQYERSIQHIFDRTSNKRCAIVWVEPGTYRSGLSLFQRITRLADITPWGHSRQTGPVEHDYQWLHPFQNRAWPCRVILKAYDRR